MSIIDIATLLAPISDATPAGEEARATDEYDLVSSEVDKLTSISAAAPIDWGLVAKHGADILATKSKDFMLAAWVSAAWMERHGIEGLKAGLELHAGLIEQYWQNGFPPLKRLRGRRNALSWWLDRAQNWLETNPPPPLEAATHRAIVDAATRIDQALAENDPDSPPLSAFVRQLKNLDALPEVQEPSPGGVTDGSEQEGTAGDTAPPPASSTAAVAHSNAAPIPAANFAPVQGLGSLDDIINALQPVTEHLAHIGSAMLEINRFHPLLIEINRFAARSTILDLPFSNGGNTALPPPPVAIADAFSTITGSGNPEGIVAFCESRIASFPFWLDLDRQSARGYGMLGEQGAAMRKAVIKNALAFVERLPGVELLNFSDGTPFASEETRQWLAECRAAQGGGGEQDAFGIVHSQAQAAANDGRHDEAMQLYQSFIQGSGAGRDQFRARIALVELLLNAYGDIDPMPMAQPLIDDCNAAGLAGWEPQLVAHAWQTVVKACRQALAQPDINTEAEKRLQYLQLRQHALQQLARVDFPSATRLSR